MIWWRPPAKARMQWWDTALCREIELTGLMASLWVKHFFPTLGLVAANDTDHCTW